MKLSFCLNPFPHIDAFWRLCSRRLFENIVTKKEIARNKQFLLLPQCFPLLVIGYPFNYRDFLCFNTKLSAVEMSYEGKGYLLNTFIHREFLHFWLNVFWVIVLATDLLYDGKGWVYNLIVIDSLQSISKPQNFLLIIFSK